MAKAVNELMESLVSETQETDGGQESISVEEIIARGESEFTEFKSTLRWHIHAQRMDKEIEHSAIKTIAAFLNSAGGTLLVGVEDDRSIRGLTEDGFDSMDGLMLHFTNRIRDWIGASFMRFIRQEVSEVNGRDVLRVQVNPAVTPAYLTKGDQEHFYIRTGPSTTSLPASEIHDYVRTRFFGG
jgi:predicted HTH transcriptional regulator